MRTLNSIIVSLGCGNAVMFMGWTTLILIVVEIKELNIISGLSSLRH